MMKPRREATIREMAVWAMMVGPLHALRCVLKHEDTKEQATQNVEDALQHIKDALEDLDPRLWEEWEAHTPIHIMSLVEELGDGR